MTSNNENALNQISCRSKKKRHVTFFIGSIGEKQGFLKIIIILIALPFVGVQLHALTALFSSI